MFPVHQFSVCFLLASVSLVASGCCQGGGLKGVHREDAVKFIADLRKSCEGGNAQDCAYMSARYGQGEGVPKDPAQAFAFSLRACELGKAESCSSVGAHYLYGEGVTRDEVRAVSFYKKACDGGDDVGCAALGAMYERGQGVPRDRAAALRLYRQACRGGKGACNELHQMGEAP